MTRYAFRHPHKLYHTAQVTDATLQACQAASWSAAHKHECAIYKDLHPRVLPVNSRAVLRILFLKSGKIKDVTQAAQQIQSFENLQSHIQEISQINKEQYERIVLSAKAVHQYSKTNIDLSTIIGYFAKVRTSTCPVRGTFD